MSSSVGGLGLGVGGVTTIVEVAGAIGGTGETGTMGVIIVEVEGATTGLDVVTIVEVAGATVVSARFENNRLICSATLGNSGSGRAGFTTGMGFRGGGGVGKGGGNDLVLVFLLLLFVPRSRGRR